MTGRRKNIMLGTAGHVDHGKTALVKLLTGCETDTLAEEKQRGLTIDLGFAPCRLADERVVGVVDVPGHVDFIRNMVAGAHGLDVVIFVVAADDGIMPQTLEHLNILTLMGVRHGLVALTKVDLVDASRRAQVIEDLRRLLASTFLAQAPVCPVSNLTGEGYDAFFDALNEVVAACEDRPAAGVFRVWVEDVFTIRGPGTVITGIPSGGFVRLNDPVRLLPAGLMGHVRRMQVYGEEADEARAGECVALNVPEADHRAVRRGMVLCASDAIVPVSMVEAEFHVLGSVTSKAEDFFEAHVHVGTAAVLGRVAMLERGETLPGERQMVQLRLAEPLPLIPGERFVIRCNVGSQGVVTIGGGRILGTSNVRLRRRKPWVLDTIAARREAIDDVERWCERVLIENDQAMMPNELLRKTFLRSEELAGILAKLKARNQVAQLSSGAVAHQQTIKRLADRMLHLLEEFHRTNPQRAGLGPEELIQLAQSTPELAGCAIALLQADKRIERSGAVFARTSWSARVTDQEQQLCDQVAAAFQKAGWSGPTSLELSTQLHQPVLRIEKAMNLLAERGVLLKLDSRTFIHRDGFEAARQVALKLFAQRPAFSTMEFRDALRVSRKYAVPLLDYFDKVRLTVRNGHDRTPGVEARKALPR